MKSSALVRKVAAVASTAVLAGLVAGLAASPAQAAAKPRVKPKVSISTPKASDREYQGSCPAKITFSSKIKVKLKDKGKTTIAYRWIHGDGSKSKVKTRTVSGKGTKYVKVSEKATFKGDVKGWQRLQVLSPRKVTSKKGYFSVDCMELKGTVRTHLDREVSARAWASPSKYVGECTPGTKIDFVGKIYVDRPAWVRYRWVVNGKTVDYGKVKVWDSRKVGVGYSPRHSQRGWAVLQVLSPERETSNRAYYKVYCKDYEPAPRGKVDASSLVTATDHNTCKVSAHASVSASGPARVRWTWQVNGNNVDSGATTFHRAGSETVRLSDTALSGAAKNGGTIRLIVFGPNNSESIAQSYAACEAPKPTVSVSSVSVTGQRNEMCADNRGPGVDFKATLSSTGPTTVKYYWVVNGKRDHNTLERQVNGSLDVTWGIGGTHGASVTSGSIGLVVISPNSASSGSTMFNVTCTPQEKPAEDKPAEEKPAA